MLNTGHLVKFFFVRACRAPPTLSNFSSCAHAERRPPCQIFLRACGEGPRRDAGRQRVQSVSETAWRNRVQTASDTAISRCVPSVSDNPASACRCDTEATSAVDSRVSRVGRVGRVVGCVSTGPWTGVPLGCRWDAARVRHQGRPPEPRARRPPRLQRLRLPRTPTPPPLPRVHEARARRPPRRQRPRLLCTPTSAAPASTTFVHADPLPLPRVHGSRGRRPPRLQRPRLPCTPTRRRCRASTRLVHADLRGAPSGPHHRVARVTADGTTSSCCLSVGASWPLAEMVELSATAQTRSRPHRARYSLKLRCSPSAILVRVATCPTQSPKSPGATRPLKRISVFPPGPASTVTVDCENGTNGLQR